MSVNPAAAAAAGGASVSAATAEQLIAAEVSALAADAVELANSVTVGQVVTAQVLPSNGLTDLISILGNRVAAALPPNFVPGDQFTAQVTGFNGPQILLQVLAGADPAATIADTPAARPRRSASAGGGYGGDADRASSGSRRTGITGRRRP